MDANKWIKDNRTALLFVNIPLVVSALVLSWRAAISLVAIESMIIGFWLIAQNDKYKNY